MNIDEIVLANIKALMRLKGFSQASLAKEAKISKENLNRLFKGHRSISKADILPDLAKALGVGVDSLKAAEVVRHKDIRENELQELIKIIGTLDRDAIRTLLKDARDLATPLSDIINDE